MNASTACGCSARGAGWLLALTAASLLIIVALTIAVAASLVFFSAKPMTGGAAVPALLVATIVLLGLILLVSLLLLWCCCRGKAGLIDLSRLLKLLPSLRNAGAALETSATALNALAQALRAAKSPVTTAADALRTAGENVDIAIPTVEPRTRNLANFGDVVVGLERGTTSPLREASLKLLAAGDGLGGQDGLATNLGNGADRCDEAAAGLRALKAALAGL